jgi:hypothetical protein
MAPPDKPEDSAEPAETGPPARQSNIRLIVAITVALLVLTGGVVTVLAVGSRDEPAKQVDQSAVTEARPIAERFVVLYQQARNDGAFGVSREDVRAVVCAREYDALEQDWQVKEQKDLTRPPAPSSAPRLTVTIKDIRVEGERGLLRLSGAQDNHAVDQDFELVKETEGWRVCGLFRGVRPPTQPGRTTSSTVPSTATETTTTTTGEPAT